MGVTANFVWILASMLMLPLIPALMLYKVLPSKTTVDGPFKGLNIKLTGGFAGYFLLVITSIAIFFPLLKNKQMETIHQQQEKIDELEKNTSAKQRWQIRGQVLSTSPKNTKIFFDEAGSDFYETGEFSMAFDCDLINGKPVLPKAVSFFNKIDGYRVLNLSREFSSEDIKNYAISFNDSTKTIRIDSMINIQSIQEARIEAEKNLIQKLRLNQVITYDPEKTRKIVTIDTTVVKHL